MKDFVIPEAPPLLAGLNSYYVNVARLLEHFNESTFSGVIHFRSFQAEAVLFLDSDRILSSQYREENQSIDGREAVQRLLESTGQNNYTIDIVPFDPDKVHFWTSLKEVEVIHSGLSSEFTDLQALIKKMGNEHLTGYIEVSRERSALGYIFFLNGEVVQDSYTIVDRGGRKQGLGTESLIEESRRESSMLSVARVKSGSHAPWEDLAQVPEEERTFSPRVLDMVQDLLITTQGLISRKKRSKESFETLFRRKCMQKVTSYDFLDPFAAEFVFENNLVSFHERIPEEELVRGVCECVRELVAETGLSSELDQQLGPWRERFANEIARLELAV